MAFVAALPAIAAVAGIGGAGISAAGAISGGIAAKNTANYQAAIANNNSIIAQQNATEAEQAGNVAAENQGRKAAARSGTLKVAQAANGVDVNTGSAVDVQASERETNYLDTETVLNNADLKAYGYRTQSANFQADEALDEATASNALPAAALKASGSLLSSASSIGGKWTGSSGWGSPSSAGPVYPPDDI